MSLEKGRFAGIPDPSKMEHFLDSYTDLNDLKPGKLVETTDGNSVRNHSERLGESNRTETKFSNAKGNVRATSPEDLVNAGITVHPNAVTQWWGEEASQRYQSLQAERRNSTPKVVFQAEA